jgi:hypothetical protein
MKAKFFPAVFLFCYAPSLLEAGHTKLLPEPQKIQYGDRSLAIEGLGIRFASPPSSEDRFAAATLSRALEEQTGIQVPIWESDTPHPAIVLTRTGNVDPLPIPNEHPGPESRESYDLKITPEGVQLSGRSSAALYYGVQTLRQLTNDEGKAAFFPEVTIEDWPALAYRGTLVDTGSEGPMCTEAEIERQLDFLARWKANQYYFYSEASIELDGYTLLNPNARFTKDQMRRIIAYGRERHIDVIPAVEMYGHLHDLFRIEKYSDLADFPHGGEFNPANPRVKALLTDWVSQLAALFPSPFVDIGFDETWTIQKAARSGEASTPVQVFLKQLNTVANLFQARGKHVMAYADIMVKFPGIISKLPPDLIAIPWFYEASPDPEYKYWLQPLIAKAVPHIVASGVHSWNEIVPDYDTTFMNIDTLLAAGRKSHALGLMNTVWTDDAQVLMRQSWPGMAYGAIAPWQSAPMQPGEFFADYARTMYPPAAAPEMAQALTALNGAEVSLQKVLGQSTMTAIWNHPFDASTLTHLAANRESLHKCRMLAEEAQEHLYRGRSAGGGSAALDNFLVGAQLLDYTGMKYLYALEINDAWAKLRKAPTKEMLTDSVSFGIFNSGHSRLADLMDAITQLRESYRRVWLNQYKDYRLYSALGRWNAEYEYWRSLQVRFRDFVDSFRAGEAPPSLQKLTGSGH